MFATLVGALSFPVLFNGQRHTAPEFAYYARPLPFIYRRYIASIRPEVLRPWRLRRLEVLGNFAGHSNEDERSACG